MTRSKCWTAVFFCTGTVSIVFSIIHHDLFQGILGGALFGIAWEQLSNRAGRTQMTIREILHSFRDRFRRMGAK